MIRSNNILYNLGTHNTIEEAVESRIAKEIELFGTRKTNLYYIMEI
ncbi:hypothetical protein CCP3SC1AL1_4620001 [Gammaproteobacteria bacterium]